MKRILLLLIFIFLITPALAADSHVVIMNIETDIYHHPSCIWAKRCTKNCIKTTKDDALSRGARACKVCGG